MKNHLGKALLKCYGHKKWTYTVFIRNYNLEQGIVHKFTKLSETFFAMECFTKFVFWVVGWVLVIESKRFRDFLEVLSCSVTCAVTRIYIDFLVIII